MHAAGHEVVARTFRRRDLDEVVRVEVAVYGLIELVPHQEALLHLGPAQIQVAVFQA